MCDVCTRATVPVTFHASWTERVPRDELPDTGDEMRVGDGWLRITQVRELGPNDENGLGVWADDRPRA